MAELSDGMLYCGDHVMISFCHVVWCRIHPIAGGDALDQSHVVAVPVDCYRFGWHVDKLGPVVELTKCHMAAIYFHPEGMLEMFPPACLALATNNLGRAASNDPPKRAMAMCYAHVTDNGDGVLLDE